MEIKNVLIKNFKSIKEVSIPFLSYGSGNDNSHAAFLVGINESGKSAILEAISLIKSGFGTLAYSDVCFSASQENEEDVDIYVDFEIENPQRWQPEIAKIFEIDSLSKIVRIESVQKNIYLTEAGEKSLFLVKIKDVPLHEYIVEKTQRTVGNKVVSGNVIKLLKDANGISEEITSENAKTYLKENQTVLTKQQLENSLSSLLKEHFEAEIPDIQLWKPAPEFLINNPISLEEFKNDNNVSQPLTNVFHIYGKTTTENIRMTIERALKSQARRDELVEKMSEAVTKHINRIWKEHKIRIRVSINGDVCQLFVEDKDKKHAYYRMEQRSEGFKHFVSLILSLSALNASDKLKDKVILIDEPEVHLHPSGVRYMRDEILKIGINNYVFVATHSHYMVDTSCPERHWIVSKEKSETRISQIGESTPIEDDDVLASAFGLNLFKELLPKTIIVVEGADDKSVIAHLLKIINTKFFYSIKTAKGASKMYSIAALLGEENVPAYFLFDDDKEGRDNKKKIIENYKESFNDQNVLTLKDIYQSLPSDGTIEDLMPFHFVKAFFEKEMNCVFQLEETKPLIQQIKQQSDALRSHSQKLDSLKISLSKKFTGDYNTKAKIEHEAPKLFEFINLFTQKIGNRR